MSRGTEAEKQASVAHADHELEIRQEYKDVVRVVALQLASKDELFRLNRLVSAFFDLAEIKAQEQSSMYMQDWIEELDKFASIYGKGVLQDKGKISRTQADKKAELEFRAYEAKTLTPIEKEYLETIKAVQKIAEKESRKK